MSVFRHFEIHVSSTCKRNMRVLPCEIIKATTINSVILYYKGILKRELRTHVSK